MFPKSLTDLFNTKRKIKIFENLCMNFHSIDYLALFFKYVLRKVFQSKVVDIRSLKL